MSSGNSQDSEPPHPWLQRQQRKTAILRQMELLTQQTAMTLSNLRFAGGPISDHEARERQAAAERKQEWDRLQNELEEINRLDGAESPVITQRPSGNDGRERGQTWHNFPQQSPWLDVSDEDALLPEDPVSTAGEAIHHAIDPEDVGESDADDELEGPDESDTHDSSDEDNKADASDNPNANHPGTRYISKKDLNERGLLGVGMYSDVYRNEANDALYFLSNLGEKIWLIDENGDSVLAQDQNL